MHVYKLHKVNRLVQRMFRDAESILVFIARVWEFIIREVLSKLCNRILQDLGK